MPLKTYSNHCTAPILLSAPRPPSLLTAGAECRAGARRFRVSDAGYFRGAWGFRVLGLRVWVEGLGFRVPGSRNRPGCKRVQG